jgi:hypothetical protein
MSLAATVFSALADFGQQGRWTEQQYAFLRQQIGWLIVSSEPVSVAPTSTKAMAT